MPKSVIPKPPVPKPPGSKQLRAPTETRQAEIVRTVVDLAATVSPDAITLQAVAQVIGVTQGAVFRHFPNREAIWLAVVDWVEGQLLTALDAGEQRGADPLDSLHCMLLAHIAFVAQHPGVPRIIFHELSQPADSATKQRTRALLGSYRKRLLRVIAAARGAGLLAPGLKPDAVATLCLGTVQGLVMQAMAADDTAGMPAAARPVLSLCLRAIRNQE
jgi:AcrR family transcriptional regulator